MSGTRSIRSLITRIDRESMRTDSPVSASTTLLARNNAQHLVDVSAQYRVSWAASTSTNEINATGTDAETHYGWEFPVTVTDNNTIPSLRISVSARLNDAGVPAGVVRAKLFGADNFSQEIWRNDWTVLSTSPVRVSHLVPLNYDWRHLNQPLVYKDDTAGFRLLLTPRTFARVLLHIQTISSSPEDGTVQLCGVHVREYLS